MRVGSRKAEGQPDLEVEVPSPAAVVSARRVLRAAVPPGPDERSGVGVRPVGPGDRGQGYRRGRVRAWPPAAGGTGQARSARSRWFVAWWAKPLSPSPGCWRPVSEGGSAPWPAGMPRSMCRCRPVPSCGTPYAGSAADRRWRSPCICWRISRLTASPKSSGAGRTWPAPICEAGWTHSPSGPAGPPTGTSPASYRHVLR